MKIVSYLLDLNFICILPIIGWMLGALILGWLLRHFFGENKEAKYLSAENDDLKLKYQNALEQFNLKHDAIEAKHKGLLDTHNDLLTKFKNVETVAAGLEPALLENTSLKSKLSDAINKPPVTVEKIIEKPVEDLTKINALETEIGSLKSALQTANNKPPVTVEKIIEKPVEDLTKINALQTEIGSLKSALQTANNKPPVTIEKIVEKPVEDLTKINALQTEIGSLKSALQTANNKPPVTIEKVVEKPVEDLTKINALQTEIGSLKSALQTANNKPPITIEKIVEKAVEDVTKINNLNSEIISLKAALEKANNKPPVIVEKLPEQNTLVKKDYSAFSKLYGKSIKTDDLKLVEGIGPKIEQLFHNAGLKTWASVAASQSSKLKEILVAAGERFQMHNPTTWPKQCQMMVDDKWAELKAYQDNLKGGREPETA